MHEGHRQRMLERLESNAEGLQDHELLEILLFTAIPRKNTNEIAHNLLNAFGNIDGVFGASLSRLAEVDGVGRNTAAFLKCVALFCERIKLGKGKFPVIDNAEKLAVFVKSRFEWSTSEGLDIYRVDKSNRVIESKRFTSKEADRVRVAPDEIGKFILSEQTHAIVAAHNHITGDCAPSAEDDYFTAQLQLLCSMNNIRLLDHLIVGGNGYFSYFMSGKMEQIRRDYSVENVIGKKGK